MFIYVLKLSMIGGNKEYLSIYPTLSIFGQQFDYLYKVSIKWEISKHENAYATECIASIGYALLAVIKPLFSSPNGFEILIHYSK